MHADDASGPLLLVSPPDRGPLPDRPRRGCRWFAPALPPGADPSQWWLDVRGGQGGAAALSPPDLLPPGLAGVVVSAASAAPPGDTPWAVAPTAPTAGLWVRAALALASAGLPLSLAAPPSLPADDALLACGLILGRVPVRALHLPGPEGGRLGRAILQTLELRAFGVDVVACPTCGRCRQELGPLVDELKRRVADLEAPLTVAVMGCEVNGPGEARHADCGLAATADGALLFRRGQVVGRVAAGDMLPALMAEIRRLAGEVDRD